MLFHTFSPAERIPSRAALQLCSIYKDRSMICFSLLLQTSNILVKQIFHGLCITLNNTRGSTFDFLPLAE